jgi:effector-binding domain-containing protein
MPYEVKLERVEPRPIAVVRCRARLEDLASVIPEACGEVWEFIRVSNLPHTRLSLALYLDAEFNLEIGAVVLRPFTSEGTVICSATPGGLVATTAHFGPYNRLGEAHQAIQDWCDAQGRPRTGPAWEIYDDCNDDPSKLRTDVFYQLDDDGQ